MAAGKAEVARLAPAVEASTEPARGGPWGKDHAARRLARGYLLQAHGLERLGRSAEAAPPLQRYVATLESSPPGTVTDDGRPIEMDIIAGRTDLSEAHTAGGNHGKALEVLEVLRLYAPKKPAELSHFDMIVSLVEARALRCAEKLDQAAAAYDRGLRRAAQLGELGAHGVPSPELTTHLNQRIEVSQNPSLRFGRWSFMVGRVCDANGTAMSCNQPQGCASASPHRLFCGKAFWGVKVLRWSGRESEATLAAAELAAAKGWPNPLQRPVHLYTAGLSTTGWLSIDEHPTVAAAAARLAAAAAALRDEFQVLWSRGAFQRQPECLHDPTRDGGWSQYPVVGDQDTGFCDATAAPTACKWIQKATYPGTGSGGSAPAGLKVRRAGFSVVEAGAHIRPHTGVDNRYLKLHLGLVVPDGDCTSFTIAGETRNWAAGRVLYFDDTFEHQVWNNCSSLRAVLQIVIEHPMAATSDKGL